ncbi:MAG: alpha/beta hydrolase [Clostridia bacterium]|nr:alpha/beta hydrolase [Clostridia bacterium]
MASLTGRAFCVIARLAGNVNPIVVEKKHKNVVKDLRSMEPLFRHYFPPIGYSFEKTDAGGVPAEVFRKKKNPSDNVVLVIHGGAYVSRMMFYYRLLNKRYSKASGGGTVVHFDYRCAPEHIYPAALEDTLAVWDWLLSQGVKPENIVTVGDSAGGHLTVDLWMKLREQGRELPHASVLMSPWLDMTAGGASYVDNYGVDPVFGIKGATITREEVKALLMKSELYMWLGDNDRTDPYISPVLNEFDGQYPPTFVTVGGDEMLFSDAQTLVEKLKNAGVEATLFVGDKMMHAYPVYQIFPEARQALKAICGFIRGQYGLD